MGINYTDILTTAPVIAATFNNPLDELDQAIKLNAYAKTAAPTVNDDSADGYTVGSRWIDTTNDRMYTAVDVTPGAAIWLETGALTINMAAPNFYTVLGTPALGVLGSRTPSWLFDDSAIESAGASIPYTGIKSGTSISVEMYWAMESATSGNVFISARALFVAVGEDMAAAELSSSSTESVPGTAKLLKKTTFTIAGLSYSTGKVLRLSLSRSGNQAADTATGDLHFLGATVRFL
jgi:hypothetical protein